jgi:hypothetical protein
VPLTHEFLAHMLGTRRSRVTVAAGLLQKAGLITYNRGSVKIENRERLEDAACECYGLIRRHTDLAGAGIAAVGRTDRAREFSLGTIGLMPLSSRS